MTERYILGLDFGTDTVRAVIVNAASGKEEANQVAPYKRWGKGQYCDPAENRFRQHPQDYIDSMEEAVKGALAQLPAEAGDAVSGIGIDTTGSTPCPVDKEGTPLMNAMIWLDTRAAKQNREVVSNPIKLLRMLRITGGVPSTKDIVGKILWVKEEAPQIYEATHKFLDCKDYIVYGLS